MQTFTAAENTVSTMPFNGSGPFTFTPTVPDGTKAGSLFVTLAIRANPFRGPFTEGVSITFANWHD
jgi:hypothetical protein